MQEEHQEKIEKPKNKKEEEVVEKNKVSIFEIEIDGFITYLDSQFEISPIINNCLVGELRTITDKTLKFISDNGEEIIKKDEKIDSFILNYNHMRTFIDYNDKLQKINLASDLMPINFVISFVCQYDAYLGKLIRAIYNIVPNLLNCSEKNISCSDFFNFTTLEDVKEYVLEKEIESIMRESHSVQLKKIGDLIGIVLNKFENYPSFIEITERRNLFVHSNGIVSSQYINNCKENNVENWEKIKLGDKLKANEEYLKDCYSILFEIGVKLGQTIWRKLKEEEIDNADTHLNSICYNLLCRNNYKLAINLLDFGLENAKKYKKSKQNIICIFNINKALAYYLDGNILKCNSIINGIDWSAYKDEFKLAVCVLKEDYVGALKFMKSIGAETDTINKDSYKTWPLFNKFRERDDFKSMFKEIYGEELIYRENI